MVTNEAGAIKKKIIKMYTKKDFHLKKNMIERQYFTGNQSRVKWLELKLIGKNKMRKMQIKLIF